MSYNGFLQSACTVVFCQAAGWLNVQRLTQHLQADIFSIHYF